MKTIRSIIKIDESLCNGCGVCVKGCHEGALQIIDGKARIVSELYCDGLGACIGDCPEGAISIEEREACRYDEKAVMERIAQKGETTILAHLKHLNDHGEVLFLKQGIEYLQEHGIELNMDFIQKKEDVSELESKMACGCPGSMERSFVTPSSTNLDVISRDKATVSGEYQSQPSQLLHWPVQLHLLNPQAGFFREADVVIAADCTAYAYADFHNRFLRGKALAIACPKLDGSKESYVAKIVEMINTARVNTLTVVIMEVPCCGGLIQLVKQATGQALRKVPVKKVVVGVRGDIKEEGWI